MKRIVRISLCMFLLVLAGACARHKIIPDRKLAQIFHDAFLANAYIGSEQVDIDSLNIYEPIFAGYGYTTEDVYYTIGNFSKRKSARLGDVVELAIEMLEAEGKYYNREVAVLDTIDNVARRTFTRTVLAEYNLSLKYLVDSLDRNEKGLRGVVWLERRDSTRTNVYTTTLRRDRQENFTRRFTVDTTHRRLWVDFIEFRGKPQRPSLTVSDLKIDYTPETSAAVDSLYMQQLDIRIFADEFFRAAIPTDSL